jgi:hypothetical protein
MTSAAFNIRRVAPTCLDTRHDFALPSCYMRHYDRRGVVTGRGCVPDLRSSQPQRCRSGLELRVLLLHQPASLATGYPHSWVCAGSRPTRGTEMSSAAHGLLPRGTLHADAATNVVQHEEYRGEPSGYSVSAPLLHPPTLNLAAARSPPFTYHRR